MRMPCVSDILSHFGLINFSNVREDVLNASLNFGRVVHETCRLYDLDALAGWDSEIDPYLEGWKKFRAEKNPIFRLIEEPLVSRVWSFAGTPDRTCSDSLLDIKTGQYSVAHQIQTALYKILIEENYGIKIKTRMCVYLKPNNYKIVFHSDKKDISIAKSLISVFNWKRVNKVDMGA